MPSKKRTLNTEEVPDTIEYGQGWGGEPTRKLVFPSGAVALVHLPGIDKLVLAGVADDIDFLQSIVQDKHIDRVKGKGGHNKKAAAEAAELEEKVGLDIMKKPGNLARLTEIMDRIAEVMVITPKLTRPVERDESGVPVLTDDGKEIPLKWGDRDKTATYTDTVKFEDRTHLLTYTVGKVADLEPFRQEGE